MNSLCLYTKNSSSRLEYILNVLLGESLGLKVSVTKSEEGFLKESGAKINYSDKKMEGILQIVPHSILSDYGVKDYVIEVLSNTRFFKIFFKTGGKEIPFDLFGASFWLLTRYEEYLPHKADHLARFHYRSSLAYQYGFLDVPLVDLWLEELKKSLVNIFPDLQFSSKKYRFTSTIDVDNAYLYKSKGFVRTVAGFIGDLLKRNFSGLNERMAIISGKKEDPFDCYDFLINTHKERKLKCIYFFLLGDYGTNDKNIAATNRNFQELIKHVADYSVTGIHPSFGSNNSVQQLKVEVNRLSNITHRQISKSRQHFSILHFPGTYRDLLQAGISDDYSLGYTNRNGFRASFCHSYRWYSLEDESATALLIHPFVFTETTAEYFAKSGQGDVLSQAKKWIDIVKKYKGELVSVFHNDTLNEGMKENYKQFISLAKAEI
jgi:hypothetical protein